MDYIGWILGKTMSVIVMWLMLGIILAFMSALPITSFVGKPFLGFWKSATQGAVTVVVHWLQQIVARVLRFVINLFVTAARYLIWVIHYAIAYRMHRPLPAAPGWVNVFPPPPRRGRRNGHGHGH